MSILSCLQENAVRFPHREGITERNYLTPTGAAPVYRSAYTYHQLWMLSSELGTALTSITAGKQQHIALLMDNCLELLPAFFGILHAGSVAVMLNTHTSVDSLAEQITRTDTTLLIYGAQNAQLASHLRQLLPDLPCCYILPGFLGGVPGAFPVFGADFLQRVYEGRAKTSHSPDGCGYVQPKDTDPAVIYFSSGSTGQKKAVLLDHGSLLFSAQVEQHAHGQTPRDVFLCIPPFYHAGALIHSLGGLYAGSGTVILRGIQPAMILDTITAEGCTIVWMPVPCAVDMMDDLHSGRLVREDYDLSSLRLVHMGAQPISAALISNWRGLFPGVAYETTYGLTEAGGPNILHSGMDGLSPSCATGKPGFGWECRIVDDHGTSLPDSIPGELIIRGRGIMQAYYKAPAATADVLSPDGWLHTGDIAYRDADGYFYIIDRKKNVIISGGENLYPAEIEAQLQKLTAVAEAVVIGMPDRRLGEVPVCAIRPKDWTVCSEEAILKACAELPHPWQPKRCFLCDIPHLATGKPDRKMLKIILRQYMQRFCPNTSPGTHR